MSDEIPYDDTNDFQWTQKAYELIVAGDLNAEHEVPGGIQVVRIWGLCPRCEHHLDLRSKVVDHLESRPGRPVRGPKIVKVPIDVTCGCDELHPGSPAGVLGCGVNFRIKFSNE